MSEQNKHNKSIDPRWSTLFFAFAILGSGCNAVPEPSSQETFNHFRNSEPWHTLLQEKTVKLKSFHTVASDTGRLDGKDTYLSHFAVDIEYLVDALAWNCTIKQLDNCPQHRASDTENVSGYVTYVKQQGRWDVLDPVYEDN